MLLWCAYWGRVLCSPSSSTFHVEKQCILCGRESLNCHSLVLFSVVRHTLVLPVLLTIYVTSVLTSFAHSFQAVWITAAGVDSCWWEVCQTSASHQFAVQFPCLFSSSFLQICAYIFLFFYQMIWASPQSFHVHPQNCSSFPRDTQTSGSEPRRTFVSSFLHRLPSELSLLVLVYWDIHIIKISL